MSVGSWDPIEEARQKWRQSGWTDAADGMSVVTSVVRVHQILMARIDAVLKPHQVTFARFELLRVLGFSREGRMSMSKLHNVLQVHPTSVTNLVDRLEADGLVERTRNPTDGRSFLVQITEAGRARAEAATIDLNDQVFASLELDPAERESLIMLLTTLRAANGDLDTGKLP